MAEKKSKKSTFKKKLVHKYRFVVLNEDTFEERFSFKLSRLRVFVLGGVFTILLIAITTVFIAFTPIKEYIPGYSSSALKKRAVQLTYEVDSLKSNIIALTAYTKSVQAVLTGNITPDSVDFVLKNRQKFLIDEKKLNASKTDSIFREKVERKDRFPIVEGGFNKAKIVFFAPLTGMISENFNSKNKHFALDIVSKTGSPIKAITDGTVAFSGWTAETGFVLIIIHSYEFISIYKHNGTLLKEQGDFVKSGEVIASLGNTGEFTTGPHLHFELWHKGYPVNPINYIDFK